MQSSTSSVPLIDVSSDAIRRMDGDLLRPIIATLHREFPDACAAHRLVKPTARTAVATLRDAVIGFQRALAGAVLFDDFDAASVCLSGECFDLLCSFEPERTKLLSQLEQAKMQEQVSASLRSMSELSAPGTTPSLDEVRDKIERRYANAMGDAELAQNSVQGRMMEIQQASVQMAGHSRLEQIRASMRGEALPSGGAATATPATPAAASEPEQPLGQ